MHRRLLTLLAAALLLSSPACFLDYNEAIPCESGAECPTGWDCDLRSFQCIEGAFDRSLLPDEEEPDAGGNTDGDAGGGEDAEVPTGPCPSNAMIHITDAPGLPPYCIDTFEASRPDATSSEVGVDTSRAAARGGVRPWNNADGPGAERACDAAGKRLCSAEEWTGGCGGASASAYPYGNTFATGICNTFNNLANAGQFAGCTGDAMTFDASGNLAEIVSTGGGYGLLGGHYNDTEAASLACNAAPLPVTPDPTTGFRCCADPR